MKVLRHIAEHPIRAFAVLWVATITGFIMWTGWWLIEILASPDWCAKAIQAEKITPGKTFLGLTTCVELLTLQLSATALNSHIVLGTIGLCLAALMVIVIAKGNVSGEFDPATGKSKFSMGSDEAAIAAAAATAAANATAGAAVDKADEIQTEGELPPVKTEER